jgi:hypothetical protein
MAIKQDEPAFSYYQLGGTNRKVNPFLVNQSDFRLIRNYRSNIFFTKEKRGGYSKFLDNPDSGKVYRLIRFKRNDGNQMVLRVSSTNIYKYAFSGATWGSAVKTSWGAIADQIQIIAETVDSTGKLAATTSRSAQGFKVGTSGSFPHFLLLIKKTGTPGDVTVELQTDSAGSPSGTVVTNGSIVIPAASITTSYTWVYAAFAIAPALTAGTQYHMVVKAATVTGSNYYELRNATNNVYGGGVFKYSTDSGATYAASSMGDMAFALYRLAGCRTGFTILNNKLILGNGGNQSMWYDGAVFTSMSAAPIARWWLTMAGRAWATGIDTNPSAVYYSKVNDPTSWTADANDVSTGGVVYVDPDNNGSIVGIDKKLGRIIVHKETGKYKIMLDEFGVPSDVIDLETDEPTQSPESIIPFGEYNYYLRETGVYRDQGTLPELISLPLGDLATNIPYAQVIDAVAGKINEFLHFSVGNVTEKDRQDPDTYSNAVLTYNKRTEEWYLDTLSHSPTTYGTWRHTDNTLRLFFGDKDGNTFIFDDVNVDGKGMATEYPIEGELIWHSFNFGDPPASKDYGHLFVYAEPGCGAIVSMRGEKNEPKEIGSLFTGMLPFHLPETYQDDKWIELRISDNSRNAQSRIYGLTIEAAIGNRRHD